MSETNSAEPVTTLTVHVLIDGKEALPQHFEIKMLHRGF